MSFVLKGDNTSRCSHRLADCDVQTVGSIVINSLHVAQRHTDILYTYSITNVWGERFKQAYIQNDANFTVNKSLTI